LDFATHPDDYRHWSLEIDASIATLVLAVDERGGLSADYALKQNSYDLRVDLELADAIERIRFEHPSVRVVVLTSGIERVFSAGANIAMLATSDHGAKVNFCKFTNETRLAMEEASRESGIRFLAALNGTAAGGGYELALACDEIILIDDGASVVSLPEVPLLGVLPGTGGLTRLLDKRGIRRDRADVFCSNPDGVRGRRALEWGLVDAVYPRSSWAENLRSHALRMAEQGAQRRGGGVRLSPVGVRVEGDSWFYDSLRVDIDREGRVAALCVAAPAGEEPRDPEALRGRGVSAWCIGVWRELDHALLRLRCDEPELAVLTIATRGSLDAVEAADRLLLEHPRDWLVNEARLLARRALMRLELTAKSAIALVLPGSCFGGSLTELLLAADRTYMLDDDAGENQIALSRINAGVFPNALERSRLETRFPADASGALALADPERRYSAAAAIEAGLVTEAPDEIDWEDEVRLVLEERAAMSPDALTGLEANLRFPGAETMASKIFGRLSAWQNWIFQRPNAVGEAGALRRYGSPERPHFDRRRC
jgi:benzoyl-CoA-dihydrodiol lyase